MTEKLIFRAQALDNSSTDHVSMKGVDLPADDAIRRQEAMSLLSGVVKAGAKIFDQGGVRLHKTRTHFVLTVPSEERDCVGRISPIICYGECDFIRVDDQIEFVTKGLINFAEHIRRGILPEHLMLMRKSLEHLKKKSLMTSLLHTFMIWIILIIMLVCGIIALFLLKT